MCYVRCGKQFSNKDARSLFELTIVPSQSFGDLTEDPGVAGDHDDQRQQEEAAESEHVVGCLVPVSDKTSSCRTLSEVLRMVDGDVAKQEKLKEERNNTLRGKSTWKGSTKPTAVPTITTDILEAVPKFGWHIVTNKHL